MSTSARIQKWHAQVLSAPSNPQVLTTVCIITNPCCWCFLLKGQPQRDVVHFVLKGISEGFS